MILFGLTKYDTILAFFVSLTLYYIINRKIIDAVVFSLLFVIIFLILLNLTR